MSSADSALGDLERLRQLTESALASLGEGDIEAVASREAERRQLLESMPWASLEGNPAAVRALESVVALDAQLRESAAGVRDSLGQRLVKQRRNQSAINAYQRVDGE